MILSSEKITTKYFNWKCEKSLNKSVTKTPLNDNKNHNHTLYIIESWGRVIILDPVYLQSQYLHEMLSSINS